MEESGGLHEIYLLPPVNVNHNESKHLLCFIITKCLSNVNVEEKQ